MSLVDQNHTNLSAIFLPILKFDMEDNLEPCFINCPPGQHHNVLMIFGYIFRTENLFYIQTSPPRNLRYSGMTQTADETKCIGVFTPCG